MLVIPAIVALCVLGCVEWSGQPPCDMAKVEDRLSRVEDLCESLAASVKDMRNQATRPHVGTPSESGRVDVSDGGALRRSMGEQLALLEARVNALQGGLKTLRDFRGIPPAWPGLMALASELSADRVLVLERMRHTPTVEILGAYGHPTRAVEDGGMWRLVYQLSSDSHSPCIAFYMLDGLLADIRTSNF